MKSKRSSDPSITIIKSDLKRFWILSLIAFVVLFLSGAFIFLMSNTGSELTEAPFRNNNNIGFIFAYILLGCGSGILCFNYMVNKKSANYFHALPVKRSRMFAAHYIAGAILIAVPVILNGMILTALAGMRFAVDYAVMTVIGILIAMVMYAITILAATVSGNIVMHVFCTGFFNGLATMLLLISSSYMGALLFGYSSSETMNELIKNSLVVFAFRNGVDLAVLISYVAVLVIVSILACLIYRIRSVENTGDSLMFGWTKQVVPGLVTILGAALSGLVSDALLGQKYGINAAMMSGIVAGFIISFIIISVITEKNQRIFTRRNMTSFAVSALIVILCIGTLSTDVMGYGSKIPAAESVKSAGVKMFCGELLMEERMNAQYFDVSRQQVGKGVISGDFESLMMLSDNENIKQALAVQRIIGERKKEILNTDKYDVKYQYSSAFDSDGRIIKRGYEAIDPATEKRIRPHLKKIFESGEVKQGYRLANLRYLVYSAEYYKSDSEDSKVIPKEKLSSLITALDKDFMDMTYEEYLKAAYGSEDDIEADRITGRKISIELYDKEGKAQRKTAYPDDDYIGTMDINLTKASEHTNQWIKENL